MKDDLILTERAAAEARRALARTAKALVPEQSVYLAAQGLAPALIERHTTMLRARQHVLGQALDAYERLRSGDTTPAERWTTEPGVVLVLTRIARGMSQKELATRLGLKEQQIQRYEADFYSGISLANLKKFATVLSVRVQAFAGVRMDELFHLADDHSDADLQKVLRFVREHGWLRDKQTGSTKSDAKSALLQYLASARDQFGSPALLRTGLNVEDYSNDLALLTWRARASELAREAVGDLTTRFDPTQIEWIRTLVRASSADDGPRQARTILARHGVCLVVVPQLPGLKLDGAAFTERGFPVIALTLRFDRIDNFWFTLLHELGHVFLHLHSGLSLGFYDDIEHVEKDVAETEADDFASSCIIPSERWKIAPARVTRNEGAVDKLATSLGVHPALLYGRIRREREDYRLFTEKVGQGEVRRWWKNLSEEPADGWTDD